MDKNKKKKKDLSICCLQDTHFRSKDTNRMRMKGWKKVFHANENKKKAWVAILISDETDFNQNCNKRQRTIHYDKGVNPTRGYDI